MKVNKKFIKKIKEGNRDAEKKLFDYTKSKIKEFLENKYPSDTNEDDTSDIVIKIFEKINKYDDKKSKYSTWITNVAKNHMIDKSRLYSNKVMFVSTSNTVTLDSLDISCSHTGDNKTYTFTADGSQYTNFENKDSINSITTTIGSTDMSMLRMKYSSGYNYEEIGKEMNMDKTQVSNRVSYIKKKIKKGS
jgi:RNA polymerase sigma-70 factor (ECF subfamily)